MKNLYNEEFLGYLLYSLRNDINDLSEWSVYNGDKCVDEIFELQNKCKEIEEKLTIT